MRQRSQIGYNLAALKFIKRQEADSRTAEFYEQGGQQEWAEDELKSMKEQLQNGNRKRKRISIKS
jgi:U3 small nucleolar RNA-associated protein 12